MELCPQFRKRRIRPLVQQPEQPFLARFGEQAPAAAVVGLRLHGAALFEVLTHPTHGGNAVAEAGRDVSGDLALVVEFKDALANCNRDGFHAQTLPPTQKKRYINYGNALVLCTDDGEPNEWSASELKELKAAGQVHLHQSRFILKEAMS